MFGRRLLLGGGVSSVRHSFWLGHPSQRWSRNLTKCHRSFSSTSLVAVSHDTQRKITTITLNYPEKFNALSVEMGEQFASIVNDLSINTVDTGCVVLTGAGKAFSAGGDLQFLRDRHHDTPGRNTAIMRKFYERMLSLRKLPVPTIAAINGPAIGAGLAIALACDMRVCTDAAKMGITFVQLGFHPGMGSTFFLNSILGSQKCARLLLTGEVINGKEAEALGLVLSSHADQAECMKAANELAEKIAKASPLGVRSTVTSLRRLQDSSCGGLESALIREADAQSQCYNSSDLIEGITSVAEKRSPNFSNYEDYGT